MTFLIPDEGDAVIVQGITGRYGSIHARLMLGYGTKVAAGVTPGKGGSEVDGVPVYDDVAEAVKMTGAKTSVILVPAPSLLSAAEEAVAAGVKLLVVITEHVPIRDTLKMIRLGEENGAMFVGPNTPGLIFPSRKLKLGIMPADAFRVGKVALFSRSGTLMYEVANSLSAAGIGQRMALGVGGDPLNCTTFAECFEWAAEDDGVKGVVLVGEIGGDAEERLAKHIADEKFQKPVVAYVAGRSAPREKHMGHAGAIIYGDKGTAQSKISALREAGALVAMTTAEIPSLVKDLSL
ncbi:MAG: succinate--CoA ligase subunit alpha [Thaumarchaeota archaeon]|nr:succinate--CoA ligase subunit alpha [Nitrososphaerota archaeon]